MPLGSFTDLLAQLFSHGAPNWQNSSQPGAPQIYSVGPPINIPGVTIGSQLLNSAPPQSAQSTPFTSAIQIADYMLQLFRKRKNSNQPGAPQISSVGPAISIPGVTNAQNSGQQGAPQLSSVGPMTVSDQMLAAPWAVHTPYYSTVDVPVENPYGYPGRQTDVAADGAILGGFTGFDRRTGAYSVGSWAVPPALNPQVTSTFTPQPQEDVQSTFTPGSQVEPQGFWTNDANSQPMYVAAPDAGAAGVPDF